MRRARGMVPTPAPACFSAEVANTPSLEPHHSHFLLTSCGRREHDRGAAAWGNEHALRRGIEERLQTYWRVPRLQLAIQAPRCTCTCTCTCTCICSVRAVPRPEAPHAPHDVTCSPTACPLRTPPPHTSLLRTRPSPQGGRATFEAIVEALRSNCPVVVVRESGGAAELVARFVDTPRPPHRNALTQQNPLCAPLAKLEPGEGNGLKGIGWPKGRRKLASARVYRARAGRRRSGEEGAELLPSCELEGEIEAELTPSRGAWQIRSGPRWRSTLCPGRSSTPPTFPPTSWPTW